VSSVASSARAGHSTDDVRPSDIALGFLTALLVLGGTVVSISSAELGTFDEDSVLAPGEIAVAVEPVDASAIEPTMDDSTSPDDAVPIPPKASPSLAGPLGTTPVPPRPDDAPAPAPPAARPERPRDGIRGLPRIESPSEPPLVGLDDLLGFGRGGPAVAPGDADPSTSPKDPYAYVDPSQEDPGAVGPGAVGDDDAEPGGDPLAARALAAYRQRLQRWLSVHFFVTDSGLSRDALRKAKIRATIVIDDDRIVVGHSIQPGGHPALEAAARRALERVMGQPVPDPPEHYPGPLQRSISVTFTCTEETCN
jgi:hypothetical protein